MNKHWTISKIELFNFMAFRGNHAVRFSDNKLVLIDGILPTGEQSNGVGKSTIIEAVYWTLTGKMVRDIPVESIVHYGENAAKVTVNFIDGDETLEITRYWSKSRKFVQVILNGSVLDFHTVADGNKYLCEVIGVNAELIALYTFYGSRFTRFSETSPRDRETMLDLMINGAAWEHARVIAGKLNADIVAEKKNLGARMAALVTATDAAIKKQTVLLTRANELEMQDSQLQQGILDEIARVNDEIDQANAEVAGIESELSTRSASARVIKNLHESITTEFNHSSGIMRDYQHAIDDLLAIKETGVCPLCKQQYTDDLEEDIFEANRRIDTLSESMADLKTKLKESDAKLVEHSRHEFDLINSKHDLQAKSTELQIAVKDLESKFKLQSCNNNLAHIKGQLKVIDDSIAENKTAIDAYIELISELDEEQAQAEFWQHGFKSIRFVLLQKVVTLLEDHITQLVCQMGLYCDKVIFRSGTKGSANSKVEINAFLQRGEHMQALGGLSDGELAKFDLACFLANGKIIRETGHMPFNFQVLDEPLSTIAEDTRTIAFDLLTKQDVLQMFVIDHDPVFQNQFDSICTIVNDSGRASIVTNE